MKTISKDGKKAIQAARDACVIEPANTKAYRKAATDALAALIKAMDQYIPPELLNSCEYLAFAREVVKRGIDTSSFEDENVLLDLDRWLYEHKIVSTQYMDEVRRKVLG